MATEIERKFLVETDALSEIAERAGDGKRLVQGYIETTGLTAVRVRRAGERAFLTIKGPGDDSGKTRSEFEYALPLADAEEMLETLCGNLVEKMRYTLALNRHVWEVDVFSGANAGLVVAEVELKNPDELVSIPDWIEREVTGQAKYYNSALAKVPFSQWRKD